MIGFFRRLFGRPDDIPPPPEDKREWNEDWRAGDLAECTVDYWKAPTGVSGPMRGRICRVVDIVEGELWNERSLVVALRLEGFGGTGFCCTSFRKLRPTIDPAEDEFATFLRDSLRQPERLG